MKHVNLSSAWQFSVEPFPAFRCGLSYGRNQHDRQFLPVTAGAEPLTEHKVSGHGSILYLGTDKTEAEEAKRMFDTQEQEKKKET